MSEALRHAAVHDAQLEPSTPVSEVLVHPSGQLVQSVWQAVGHAQLGLRAHQVGAVAGSVQLAGHGLSQSQMGSGCANEKQ